MTRILVTGCRHWLCYDLAVQVVRRLVARYGADLAVVHGAAPGVDSAFMRAAILAKITHEPHPAEWNRYGKRAGPHRNETMVKLGASLCIAVHRDIASSKGTKGCARLAIEAGIPTWLIDNDDVQPRRITGKDLTT